MTKRRSSGYTLLEICLVLGILAVMVAIAIPSMHGLLVEQRMGQYTNSYRDIAATGRMQAVEKGEARVIRFQSDRLVLERRERETPDVIAAVRLPKDVAYQIRRNSKSDWQRPDGQTWIFQDNGLCEYLEIRTRIGSSWSEIAFNPLTAVAKETACYYP